MLQAQEILEQLPLREYCIDYGAIGDNLTYYSIEGKAIIVIHDNEIEFYTRPEYRRRGLAMTHLRKILHEEINRRGSLEVSFEDDWFKQSFYDRIPHDDILTFATEKGFYLVKGKRKGKFIENPYIFKV